MTDILMPRLSDTMEEGVVSAWRKQVGDEVHPGDVLVEIETDKAVMEHEAYEEGVLGEILVKEGDTAPIGAPIARLVGAGEPVGGSEPAPAAPAPAPAPAPELILEKARDQSGESDGNSAVTPRSTGAGRILSSPLARRDARELGVDLATVPGSGPGGRIIRADVAKAASAAPAAPVSTPAAPAAAARAVEETDELIPLTSIRKTIARRLTESMQSSPHFYVTKTIDAGPLSTLRAQLNERLVAAEKKKVSVNDIIVRAVAVVLRDHPVVNSSFTPEAIVQHGRIHVGIAVATETGLVVPVIRDADTKSLTSISAETRTLAGKARDRKLGLDEMTGGTFTVSNLGMYGIDHFTAVINPPEAAILAVGAVRPEPGVKDGELAVVQKMTMTLSSDHRVIDGAQAAEFVRDLAAVLEDPWLAIA
ncbi:dihydrolipoamide acetyltransferase family protein [Jiangella alkaliphila]|uniref:Dihydrolipoamide acetyltransferase component of pyruvate dehydrogenase complex n=1 Tax=Jiangella alkaliphila TaxID=419479 RepID=A0A1H2H8M1_9ACTN|nr:dihydrolipoamide acetyltransferase family protein [Jiangella alkaliphila]SDU28089.1 pyruvate dehydrogenase E2 component (dihydrolipoamide acetyltransferase) [Jiangella alkaliphila]